VSVTVRITKSFKTAVKPLLKKYPSLRNDLLKLEQALLAEPKQGTSLGNNVYKIRLKIASKGKGKSGGARVISLVETVIIGEVEVKEEEITVNLLTIYNKADTANITDRELKDLIKGFHEME
jgi:mRNA-degrading endonuclease RelE of RelBE toxin-antitoxin system